MCDPADTVMVQVIIPADLSTTGYARIKDARIDRCIAPLVAALHKAHIDMRGSCCGHGWGPGDIHLEDGRLLLILEPKKAERYLAMRKRRPHPSGRRGRT